MSVQERARVQADAQSQFVNSLVDVLTAIAERLNKLERKVDKSISRLNDLERSVGELRDERNGPSVSARGIYTDMSALRGREENLRRRLEMVTRARDDKVRYMDTTPVSIIIENVKRELTSLPEDPMERALKISELEGMLDAADLMLKDDIAADRLAILKKRGYFDVLVQQAVSARGPSSEWNELEGRATDVIEQLDNFSKVYSVQLMIPLKVRVQRLVEEGRKALESGDAGRLREVMGSLRGVLDLIENDVLSNGEVLRRLRIEE